LKGKEGGSCSFQLEWTAGTTFRGRRARLRKGGLDGGERRGVKGGIKGPINNVRQLASIVRGELREGLTKKKSS